RFGGRMGQDERHRQVEQQMREFFTKALPKPAAPSAQLALRTVIVIGAGLAGLSAAWWLKRMGLGRVVVLEARDAVGGRVRSLTDFSPGRIIEAGAELIGVNHPLWHFFARKFGLGLTAIAAQRDYQDAGLAIPTYLNGSLLDRDQLMLVYHEMTAALEQISREAEPVDPYRPWRTPDAAALDAQSVAERLAALPVSELTREALRTHLENDNAATTEHQSYLGLLSLVRGGGLMNYWRHTEIFRCDTGNQMLATRLLHAVQEQEGSRVLLAHPVGRITITDGGDHAVVTASGTDFGGDYVVLAVPPSIWPEIAISPALPPYLRPHLGPAVKYLSNLRSRFWVRAGLAPCGLSDELGETWEGTDTQAVPATQGCELTVFAGGPEAEAALSAPDPRHYFTAGLEPLLPGYSDNVLNTLFAAWPRAPWTRTGYSAPAPGQVTTIGPVLNSAHHGRLFFAGEHVSTAFFGHMEGALQSGLLAALRILRQEGVPSAFADI
ncbi:MAG: hypothetical protein JWN15_3346, partial [Firmicutes bacterium]|nr:hypothetical protein [Bacillota bacterium]